jgi:outer membrane protein assembly factor BamB
MLQRCLKTLAVFAVSVSVVVTSCRPKKMSTDEPLSDEYSPSIYIGSQNQFLYAIDPATGAKKWEYNMHANMISTPIILKGENKKDYIVIQTVNAISGKDSLIALDAHKGKFINGTDLHVPQGEASLATDGKEIIYGVGKPGEFYKYRIKKLIDGRPPTEFTSPADYWTNSASAGAPSPTLYKNLAIFMEPGGNFTTYDVTSGAPSWSGSVGVNVTASPVIAPPYMYVCGMDGKLYAIHIDNNLINGTVAWTYTTPDEKPILSSPIVYGGNVIFGCSDYNVYCIDSAAKTPRWIFKTDDRVVSSPFAYNQVIYVGSYDYFFYAINIIDGKLKWKYKTGAIIKSSPLAVEGKVYVAGFDKILYAFDTTGAIRWQHRVNGQIETSPIIFDLNKTYYPAISGMSEN